MCEILAAVPASPLGAECRAIHGAVGGRALPVAQSWMESRYGQDDNARLTHNPLGLLWFAGSPLNDRVDVPIGGGATVPLLRFSTWAAAFQEWARRMDDPTYKGGVYMPHGITMERFITIYVGGPGCSATTACANGETWASVQHYLRETVARLNRYIGATTTSTGTPTSTTPSGPGTTYSVAGLGTTIHLPFPLRVDIIPTWQTNQRPGIPMNADRFIQHETGNPRVGANARAHRNYLFDGAEGQKLSYHFAVDEDEAWQMIPVDEVAWHGGDSSGPCNMKGVASELTINVDQDQAKARHNATILAARIMDAMALGSIRPHVDCIGTDHYCPQQILNSPGGFPKFRSEVNAEREHA
jgi:hypothetical protein